MILAPDTILAIAAALQRERKIPQKEWFAPIIQRLQRLQPGERLTIERMKIEWMTF